MTTLHATRTRAGRYIVQALILAFVLLGRPQAAAAHCDSLDGPVVAAARAALESGDVHRVLVWVRAEDEPEIREAFQRTLDVRSLGGTALELADRWFYETVVRVHREGEGAPYTGLKPSGQGMAGGIAAAEEALRAGSADGLAAKLGQLTEEVLRERFTAVMESRGYAPDDLAAGRRSVARYVEYIHFVEALHAVLAPEQDHEHPAEHPDTAHPDGPGPAGE